MLVVYIKGINARAIESVGSKNKFLIKTDTNAPTMKSTTDKKHTNVNCFALPVVVNAFLNCINFSYTRCLFLFSLKLLDCSRNVSCGVITDKRSVVTRSGVSLKRMPIPTTRSREDMIDKIIHSQPLSVRIY